MTNPQDNESHPSQDDQEEQESSVDFPPAGLPKQITLLDSELKNLQQELMDYKNKYLRTLADTENVRKRMQKEREEFIRYAMENLITDFLHPLDNFENALKIAQNMSDEVKNWAFGFQMILTQFKDILNANGIQPIESVGMNFDPHIHEAVEVVETTEKPGVVLEEYIRGYKMGDRVIRPARVKVTKATETKGNKNEKQETNEN